MSPVWFMLYVSGKAKKYGGISSSMAKPGGESGCLTSATNAKCVKH